MFGKPIKSRWVLLILRYSISKNQLITVPVGLEPTYFRLTAERMKPSLLRNHFTLLTI